MPNNMKKEQVELSEDYRRNAAKLIKFIEKRDEMKDLLKLATADKVADVKYCIAELDKIIERSEVILEMEYKICVLQKEQVGRYKKLDEVCDLIEPELIKYVTENNPEKLPELMEMLTGKKSH